MKTLEYFLLSSMAEQKNEQEIHIHALYEISIPYYPKRFEPIIEEP